MGLISMPIATSAPLSLMNPTLRDQSRHAGKERLRLPYHVSCKFSR
jgi:hypothetical protein